MPRKLRIDHPGAFHHVTNRGRNRQATYRDDGDRLVFIDVMEHETTRHHIKVIAFTLMGNHFHLLLQSMRGELSAAMQQISGVYTQQLHRKYGTDGALFKGRFFSKLIDTDAYLMEGYRYVANNPVAAGMVASPELYRWSSHGTTIGHNDAYGFVDSSGFLHEYFANDPHALQAFVTRQDSPQAVHYRTIIESQVGDQRMSESVRLAVAAQRRFADLRTQTANARQSKHDIVAFTQAALGIDVAHALAPFDPQTRFARAMLATLLVHHGVASAPDVFAAVGYARQTTGYAAIRAIKKAADSDPETRSILTAGQNLTRRAA